MFAREGWLVLGFWLSAGTARTAGDYTTPGGFMGDHTMLIRTHIVRNWGTDHEYINDPSLAALWQSITGRKTIDRDDKANFEALGRLFDQAVEFELTAGPVLGVTVHRVDLTNSLIHGLRPPAR